VLAFFLVISKIENRTLAGNYLKTYTKYGIGMSGKAERGQGHGLCQYELSRPLLMPNGVLLEFYKVR